MKRSGSPHPPRTGPRDGEGGTSRSETDAQREPPAALRIAATAGAPPGATSVCQYVDENARAITPDEELGESALALSLLLIGQLEKLHSQPHPEPELLRSFVAPLFLSSPPLSQLVFRTQRELSTLAERYPFLVQNELMTQVLTWFLGPEYCSAHRSDGAPLARVAASIALAGYFGTSNSSSGEQRTRRALPCAYVRAYAQDVLGVRAWTSGVPPGGLGERISDVLGGRLVPPWAGSSAAWVRAAGDALVAVVTALLARTRALPAQQAALKLLARSLAPTPCRALLAALLADDTSTGLLAVPALAPRLRKAITRVRRFVGAADVGGGEEEDADVDQRVVAALAHAHTRPELQAAAVAALDEIVARAPALFAGLLDSAVTTEFLQDVSNSSSSVSVGLVVHLWKSVPSALEVLARLMARYVQRAGVRSGALCAALKRFLPLTSDGSGGGDSNSGSNTVLSFTRAMLVRLEDDPAWPLASAAAAERVVENVVEVLCFVLLASVPCDLGAECASAGNSSNGTRTTVAGRFLAAAGEFFGIASAWAVHTVPRLFALPGERTAMAHALGTALRALLLLDAPRCARDSTLLSDRTRHHAQALLGEGRPAPLPLASATVRALSAAATAPSPSALSRTAALHTLVQLAESATLFVRSPLSSQVLSSSTSSFPSLLMARTTTATSSGAKEDEEDVEGEGQEKEADTQEDEAMTDAKELTADVLRLAECEGHADGLCNTERLWRACVLLVLLSALAPQTVGRHVWAHVPTARALLETVLTQQWDSSSPDGVVPEQVHFVASETLLVPPRTTVETVRTLATRHGLARTLAAQPAFLADVVGAAQSDASALAWLAPLAAADAGVAAALPLPAACALLDALHRAGRDTAPLLSALRAGGPRTTAAVVAVFVPRLAAPARCTRTAADALLALLYADARTPHAWPAAVAARLAPLARTRLCAALAAACAAATDPDALSSYFAFLRTATAPAAVLALVRTALVRTRPLLAAAYLATASGRATIIAILSDAETSADADTDAAAAAEVAFALLSCTPPGTEEGALPDVVRRVCRRALIAEEGDTGMWRIDDALGAHEWHPAALERLTCAPSSSSNDEDRQLREHARIAAAHALGCARVLPIVAAPGLDTSATAALLHVLVAQGSRCTKAAAALPDATRNELCQMLAVYRQVGVTNSIECTTLCFPQT